MKAIIPAAGYATRMYPLTKDTPKGLLRVAGRSILEHVISRILPISEVDAIYIVTNDKFYENFLEWQAGFECPIPIEIVNDRTKDNESRLGAIGDKHLVIREKGIDEDVLDICSDCFINFSLLEMYRVFKEKKAPVIGVYDVKSFETAKRFGIVELGENNKVVGFVEKPQKPKTTLASIAIYMYPKEVVRMFSEYLKEGNNPDAPGYFFEWLYKKQDVFAFTFNRQGDRWFDIGSIELYEQAKKEFGD